MTPTQCQILEGHAIDQLRELKRRGVKVNCIVTSPPYWGLRGTRSNRG